MLRLPKFELVSPRTVDEALALLDEPGLHAMVIAGGTDLVPNMKHELFTPDRVVALAGIEELRGVRVDEDGALVIGAMTPLAEVAADERVQAGAPAVAQAVSLIAGPQLRTMGTLGGNVLLDTRCQWYNQTHFWRQALGFCLKKDGTLCHVIEKGQKCVAAASNDSAPALMTRGAQLVIASRRGVRTVPIDEFWRSDGIYNKKLSPNELLLAVRIPPVEAGRTHHGAYGKLRQRGSIDFPLLGVACRIDCDADDRIVDADLVLTALAARPARIKPANECLQGVLRSGPAFEDAVAELADRAYKHCRPLENIPGDAEYRREMVPVYVRRTLLAAAADSGPVHHI